LLSFSTLAIVIFAATADIYYCFHFFIFIICFIIDIIFRFAISRRLPISAFAGFILFSLLIFIAADYAFADCFL